MIKLTALALAGAAALAAPAAFAGCMWSTASKPQTLAQSEPVQSTPAEETMVAKASCGELTGDALAACLDGQQALLAQ